MTDLEKSLRIYKDLSEDYFKDDEMLLAASAEVIQKLGIDDPERILPGIVLHLHKGIVAQGFA